MTPKTERMASLDVMRGVVVVGMIVVNAVAFVRGVDDFDVYPVLLHSEWAGVTLADLVFPAFVFMVGVSIAIARLNVAPTRATLLAITMRSLRLITAGLVISNLYWAAHWDENGFRVMGVLQRIGLCYFASAILYLTVSARARLILTFAILVLYWPLTLAPMPDGQVTNLFVAGANFVSWFDRAIFGPFNFVRGSLGFDPEGLIGTLPAISQCLLGVAAGEWLWKNARRENASRDLALVGAAMALAGSGWSVFFPMIKALWTSSFVLFSTGLATMLLALCHHLFDRKQWRGAAMTFFVAFGINTVFAYILHELAMPMLESDLMRWFDEEASEILSSREASLIPVTLLVLMLWAPLRYLQRRGWIIRI